MASRTAVNMTVNIIFGVVMGLLWRFGYQYIAVALLTYTFLNATDRLLRKG